MGKMNDIGILRLRQLCKLTAVLSEEEKQEKKTLLGQYYGTLEYKWLMSVVRAERRRAVIRAGAFTKQDWLDILKLQKERCKYCRKRFTEKNPATVDHIRALKPAMSYYGGRGAGRHERKNIVAACRSCNSKKNNGRFENGRFRR
jgi:hypothetical protein